MELRRGLLVAPNEMLRSLVGFLRRSRQDGAAGRGLKTRVKRGYGRKCQEKKKFSKLPGPVGGPRIYFIHFLVGLVSILFSGASLDPPWELQLASCFRTRAAVVAVRSGSFVLGLRGHAKRSSWRDDFSLPLWRTCLVSRPFDLRALLGRKLPKMAYARSCYFFSLTRTIE